MYKFTENLSGYEKLSNTNSCYLDGRYFDKVFIRYPGLLSNPLEINIRSSYIKTPLKHEEKERYNVSMRQNNVNTKYPGLLRVVIHSPKGKHSNLLILDYENQKVYHFKPLGKEAPYYDKVNEIISGYLSNFFSFDLEVLDVDFDEILDEKNPKCSKSGFCVAYIILYAYCFLNQIPFPEDVSILKFAHMVEKTYGSLPLEDADKYAEYGLFGNDNPNQGRNALIGGVGLGTIGAIAAGPPGLLIGSLGGLTLGGMM